MSKPTSSRLVPLPRQEPPEAVGAVVLTEAHTMSLTGAVTKVCEHCGAALTPPTTGRPPRYCSPAHRTAAWRARGPVGRPEHPEPVAAPPQPPMVTGVAMAFVTLSSGGQVVVKRGECLPEGLAPSEVERLRGAGAFGPIERRHLDAPIKDTSASHPG